MAFRTNKTPVLQEKTASGSVASFNTILQKPLVNGEFTIQAYQEGTGDPAPDNVRPIHGFSEVNATRCGVNVWDEEWEFGGYDANGNKIASTTVIRNKNLIPVKPNTTYYFKRRNNTTVRFVTFDINKVCITSTGGHSILTFTVPNNCYYIGFNINKNQYNNDVSINYPSTDTDYHAYNGNDYTKALGEDVYGGFYNSDTGKLKLTHVREIKALSDFYGFDAHTGSPCSSAYIDVSNDMKALDVYNTQTILDAGFMSNKLKTYYGSYVNIDAINSIRPYSPSNKRRIWCLFDESVITQLSDISSVFGETIQIRYPLETPIEIQLTPEEIQTFNGVNNIFCDTGDTSVVFNDLDLAKRGSFREVFKLPS